MRLTKIIKTSNDGPFEDHIWKYELMLPKHLAEWDVYDYWEKERLFSIEKELKRGDIFFDVGSEQGWLPALIAKYMVGAESMVLFEPSPYFWPNIKAIFEGNDLPTPLASVPAFVGNKCKKVTDIAFKYWPKQSEGEIVEAQPYKYLHNPEDVQQIPTTTIDNFVRKTNIIPRALNIDVEGAELLVLQGSKMTLKRHRPIVWVSVHPDLLLKDYNTDSSLVLKFMDLLNYKFVRLAIDHEEHWLFKPIEES